MTTRAIDRELRTGPSLFLDFVRLGAALMVAIGHINSSQFSTGSRDLTILAVNSVTASFVLSGFVIRYVTVQKPATLGRYAIDRISRVYSVLLPALLFTLVADSISRWVNPVYYRNEVGGFEHALSHGLAVLTCTSYMWHRGVAFLSDGPAWSLTFECIYYAIYGVFFYLAGARRYWITLAVALLAGPDILSLLPIWLFGCLLFEVFIRTREGRLQLSRPALLGAGIAAAALLLTAVEFRTAIHAGVARLASLDHRWQAAVTTSPSLWAVLAPHFKSPVSLDAYPWSVVFFVALLLGLWGFDRLEINRDGAFARWTRTLAEATFPLYLFHIPMYVLIVAVMGHKIQTAAGKTTIVLLSLAISVVLGALCGMLKLWLRGWLRALSAASKSGSSKNFAAETRQA